MGALAFLSHRLENPPANCVRLLSHVSSGRQKPAMGVSEGSSFICVDPGCSQCSLQKARMQRPPGRFTPQTLSNAPKRKMMKRQDFEGPKINRAKAVPSQRGCAIWCERQIEFFFTFMSN